MDNEKTEIKADTLDFIFEYTKNAPEAQLKDVEALDSKVIQILSISSVIVGLIGFAIGESDINPKSLTALIIALAAYMALAILAFVHLKTTSYRRSIQADVLWNTLWAADIKDIKHLE
ncbi:MAG: hypothetical protein AABZ77_08275 [Chloroflexota bacterium]